MITSKVYVSNCPDATGSGEAVPVMERSSVWFDVGVNVGVLVPFGIGVDVAVPNGVGVLVGRDVAVSTGVGVIVAVGGTPP